MRLVNLCTYIALSLTCLTLTTGVLRASDPKASQASSSQDSAAPSAGEQVFKAQCSRCHMPPMSISPRVAGTVIMHMRTRARLSRRDEQALLQYLAP